MRKFYKSYCKHCRFRKFNFIFQKEFYCSLYDDNFDKNADDNEVCAAMEDRRMESSLNTKQNG